MAVQHDRKEIRAGDGPITVINVFNLPADNQDEITGPYHGVLLSFMVAVLATLVLIGR